MPDLDGISFCRELINYPIKKIMLTGSNDRAIATEAFNEGIIDFFLLKESANLSTQIINAINTMQKDYFFSLNNLTNNLTAKLATSSINPNSSLTHFLQAKMKQFNAVEFYLLDRWGSMLFIQYDGTPITLVISPRKMIDAYAAIAHDHEEQSIGDLLLTKKKLLFFSNEIDCMRPVSEWQNFLFEAKPLPDQSDLFYTVIETLSHQPINMKKILSQKAYMNLI